MGMGDVKLVFLIGLFLQWDVYWILYLAILCGGIWAIMGLSLRSLNQSPRLAFAPFLGIGILLNIFFLPLNKFLSLWM